MENFETLRLNVLINIIPNFFMGVRESKDCDEIRVSAMQMFESMVENAYPNHKMTLKPAKSGKKIVFKGKMDKAPSPVEKAKSGKEDMKKGQPAATVT